MPNESNLPCLASLFRYLRQGSGAGTFRAGRFGVAGIYGRFGEGLAEGLGFADSLPLPEVFSSFASLSLELADGTASAGFASSFAPQLARPEARARVIAVAMELRFRFVMMAHLRHVFMFRT